ncbi:MAG: phosphotransferase enzyme family protein [Acidobacteriota bacterium]
MHEPPNLPDDAIIAALQASYGISIASLTFLPIGYDSTAWVYRVETVDRTHYFLKIRAGLGNVRGIVIPRFVQDRGVPHIAAPLPTRSRALWATVNDFALILYPFIDGRTGVESGLSDDQWTALGALVRQVHSLSLPPDLVPLVRRDPFTPVRRELIPTLETLLTTQPLTDPIARELAALWRAKREEIDTLVERADTLGRQLRQDSPPLVLCHADLHTWNVLVDRARQLWVVDWDETILAPQEQDLMFFVRGIGRDLVSPHDTECFLRGYGDTAIDSRALAYYRYAWAVQDLAAYGELAVLLPGRGDKTRRQAVAGFLDTLAPGSIADIALSSDI